INDTPNDKPVVLFYQKGKKSVLDAKDIEESKDIGQVTVFSPVVDGEQLTFTKTEKGFEDKKTSSLWNITGKCIKGKFIGKKLNPVVHGNHFAFAWFAFNPDSEVYGKNGE
ncbi:MAG: DUF3179 domain-containing (seleno)protein, partial [Flavobacteriales bacterium]